MKRVKAGCIFQTLVFMQKEDCGLSKEHILKQNREEFERYKAAMERAHTRYQITDVAEQEDGSIVVHVRKQYNEKAEVNEYFE